jgi:uncharacterized protein YggE
MTMIAALVLGALVAAPVRAQPIVGQEPGIVAIGYGVAHAPADVATLQFLVQANQFFGGAGVIEGFPPVVGEATPGSDVPPMESMGGPPTLTEEQITPVIDALVAAGAPETDITVTIPAATSMMGPGGPEIGEIRLTMQQPGGEQLRELVNAVHGAAAGAGLQVFHVGALYEPADCAALVQEAREAAIADAEARAQGLAAGLNQELGELVQASETPYFGPVDSGSCAPAGMEGAFGMYGPGTLNTFNPETTDATVTVQVVLTYALGPTV